MTHTEMVLKLGFYSGFIGHKLGDHSHASRWWGRAEELTEEDYFREIAEIQQKLVDAGVIGPDEDPWEQRGEPQKL